MRLVGLAGPLSFLFESLLVVLASNAVFVTVLLYSPSFIGSMVWHRVAHFIVEGSSPFIEDASFSNWVANLFVGYLACALLVALYVTVSTFVCKILNKRPDVFTRATVTMIVYAFTFVKIVTMVCVNFVVSPIVSGMIINVITAEFFDKTVQDRIAAVRAEPISSTIL